MSQTARRTLQLVEAVAAIPPAGLMELSEYTGFDKSTTARLLAPLVERAWLLRDPETRKYSVGPTLVGMSLSAGLSDLLRLHLFPLLQSIRGVTTETISLQRRFGNVRMCVSGMESQEALRRALPLGMALPLAAGPSGKVILAFAEDSDISNALSDLDERSQTRLHDDLAFIRKSGYLSTDSDRTPDVSAISVPLFAQDGVFGSVTVAGPMSRFTPGMRQRVLPALLDAAAKFTRALGGESVLYETWASAVSLEADELSQIKGES